MADPAARARVAVRSQKEKNRKREGGKRNEQLQSIIPGRARRRVPDPAMRAGGVALRPPPQKKDLLYAG